MLDHLTERRKRCQRTAGGCEKKVLKALFGYLISDLFHSAAECGEFLCAIDNLFFVDVFHFHDLQFL